MWNIGRGRNGSPGSPTGRGFEVYKRPDDVNFEKDAYMDGKGRYLSDALCDEALSWIDKDSLRLPAKIDVFGEKVLILGWRGMAILIAVFSLMKMVSSLKVTIW